VRYKYDQGMLTSEYLHEGSGGQWGLTNDDYGRLFYSAAAPGNPWSWRGCYWDHEPQAEVELLKRGFYIAYVSSSATLRPGKEWDAWYQFLITKGLSPKPAFIGMSRGGEFEYTWATNNPGKVSCIYADNPAATKDILMKLGGLAKYDVPLLHVCGSLDPLYPTATLPIENIYQQFGGRVSVMVKEGFGHHPHSLRNPKPIADFIEQSFNEVKPTSSADFANGLTDRSAYYNSVNDYGYVTVEKAFITSRGPFFTGYYNRYRLQIPGVEGTCEIVEPRNPAPGKPWVFRPDYLSRDAAVDQALLAKGFYIVTGATPYNFNGPVLAHWNTIYKYLTDFGFSKKPVMEGNGGEAIAWAIENPDKVTCIYAENPIFKSILMTKISPLDNLGPLARAKIPMMLVSGSLDPSFNDQTRVAEKRYKDLGGEITVVVRKGEGHYLLQGDVKGAVDFITGR
jgi:hypothetical protein